MTAASWRTRRAEASRPVQPRLDEPLDRGRHSQFVQWSGERPLVSASHQGPALHERVDHLLEVEGVAVDLHQDELGQSIGKTIRLQDRLDQILRLGR